MFRHHTALLGITLLLVVVTEVSCRHPKMNTLQGSSSSLRLQDHQQHNQDQGGDDSYRIRRQNSRGRIVQITGLHQLVPMLNQLSSKLRSLDNKLGRHEYREAQVADFTSKTLNALTADHSQSKSTLEHMAKQLAAVEERVMATLILVTTADERQAGRMLQLSEGLDRLLLLSSKPTLGRSPNAMPDMPPEMIAQNIQTNRDTATGVRAILSQIEELHGVQDSRIKDVASEVLQLGADVNKQLEVVNSRQEGLMTVVQTCAASAASAASTNDEASDSCLQLKEEMIDRLEKITQVQQGHGLMIQDLKESTEMAVDLQQAELQNLLEEVKKDNSDNIASFSDVLEGLKELESVSQINLGNLHSNLKSVVEENNELTQKKIKDMEKSMKEAQENIMGSIDDAASMTDNLQTTVSDNYELLSKEISGLNKIEQVMINTADAVLDTKRSIEFGIQQVILELSDIVSKSGSKINSTLSNQINAISFNILKNQTFALTKMTQRMEGEISQVWRQIGIMYQQVEQSINMLDNLQDTTDQHMNVSLSRVGDMGGTVGEINGKVADVEDNLNYLLGRLSLVVSEFNHMKVGVGNELDKLRLMAQEISIPNEEADSDNLKYNINRKRHIINDYGY